MVASMTCITKVGASGNVSFNGVSMLYVIPRSSQAGPMSEYLLLNEWRVIRFDTSFDSGSVQTITNAFKH